MELPGAVPEIPVQDVDAAATYYVEKLGFTLDWVGEDIGLAGISRGNCRMFLASSEFRKHRGNVAPVLIWLNLNSKEEVDELFRLWKGSEAEIVSEPESNPWGLHEFVARDLDGNLFRVFYDFGTPGRGDEPDG